MYGHRPSSRDSRGPRADRENVSAIVKWYNETKGFGFVAPEDGSPDAFLHVSVVERSPEGEITQGTLLVCDIGESQKGPQVTAIHSIEEVPRSRTADAPPARGPSSGSRNIITGTVKWFSFEKGFGFIVPEDGSKDIFVSKTAVQRAGLRELTENQRVRMTVSQGQKGPIADAIEVLGR